MISTLWFGLFVNWLFDGQAIFALVTGGVCMILAGVATLFVDKDTGSITALIRMAPGARLPDHEHPLSEQSFVLEGVLEDDDGRCTAGDFVWRPAGSRHQAWSQGGCVVLGIFQVPNKFFEEGGRIADVLGHDWEAAWSHAGNLRAAG